MDGFSYMWKLGWGGSMELEGEVQEHGRRRREERVLGISAHRVRIESLHNELFSLHSVWLIPIKIGPS